MLFLTSGSTGNSKAVALTHGNILASLKGKTAARRLSSADVVFNWVSLDHVVALIEGHILPLYIGAVQVHAPAAQIIAEPLSFLKTIDQFRVTTTFTPNFLLGQINEALQAGQRVGTANSGVDVDLSCVRHIFSGGEANPVATGARFLNLLSGRGLSRGAIWPAWGMTETCAGAVYSQEFPAHDSGRMFATVGRPIDGIEIRIVDDQEAPCPSGVAGELHVRGPLVFERYHNNQTVTNVSFTEDKWFRTGDRALIDDGRLMLVGRSKDCIIVNGVNYFSQELEAAIESLAGVERSFVAAFPTRSEHAETEQLIIAFAPTFHGDEARLVQTVVAVRNTAVMLWGFRPSAVIPLTQTSFPKTNLGKIQRPLMRQRFEAGKYSDQLAHIESMIRERLGPYTKPDGPVEFEIVEIIAGMFALESETLSATANFFELGGTSLEILRLTHSLDEHFEFEATLATVLQNPTARELAARIALGGGAKDDYFPAVPLQLSGSRIPLFLIHPGDGGTFVFVNLAKYFVNERPVYALRARGFDRDEKCFASMDEVVNTYMQAMRARQPKGPYAIAGYSLGASIAYEIAKAFALAGDKIAFLACIDGLPCGTDSAGDFAATLLGASQVVRLIDEKHFSAWSRVANSLHVLSRGHVMSGTIDSMAVFASEGLPPTIERNEWKRRLRGWDSLVQHPRYIDVEGDHNSLMSPAHVATFQAVLRSELDRSSSAIGEMS
jgi:thioesterase domain-containing protein/acyl carrier protein